MIWDWMMMMIVIECKSQKKAPQLSLNFKMQHYKRFMRKHKFCRVMFSSSFSLWCMIAWCIPWKTWPHASSRVSSWWYLCEYLAIPGDNTEHWVACFYFMWLFYESYFILSPKHPIWSLAFWEFGWLITPKFLFPWHASLSLHLMPALPYSLALLWYICAFQCHLQSLSVPFEHSPRWRGERSNRLEWHHSWKTSRRWKMSMNSRLISSSLNSTYILVPKVIHKIFWTFRIAWPIGNRSWTRRIRCNTAVGGHMSLSFAVMELTGKAMWIMDYFCLLTILKTCSKNICKELLSVFKTICLLKVCELKSCQPSFLGRMTSLISFLFISLFLLI